MDRPGAHPDAPAPVTDQLTHDINDDDRLGDHPLELVSGGAFEAKQHRDIDQSSECPRNLVFPNPAGPLIHGQDERHGRTLRPH